jgi:hypothetical protein
MRSANATQTTVTGSNLAAVTAIVNGAVAYAWYAGAAGSETLQAITTINSVAFTAPFTAGRQAATVITADFSQNVLGYDGFMSVGYQNGGSQASYVQALGNGVAGVGVGLTSSGYGSVTEIDLMLKSMWDLYRVSPTVIYVNSQEQRSITKLSFVGTGGVPLIEYNIMGNGESLSGAMAGQVIAWYFNPYSVDGGTKIPVKIHPNLAPGTILTVCETLPAWYVQNETPAVAEVLTRKDYYTEVWQKVARRQDYGIYCQSALAIYAAFAIGIITNIAPTP